MIQKPRGKKKVSKAIKRVKKFNSTERAIGNSETIQRLKGKAIDEAYDRGFNDGYSKGIEDGGLDEPK